MIDDYDKDDGDDIGEEEGNEDGDDLWRQSYPSLGCHGQTQSTELFLIWKCSPLKAGSTNKAWLTLFIW